MKPAPEHHSALTTMLQMLCPWELPAAEAEGLAAEVLAWCRNNNVNGPSDFPAAADLVHLAWQSIRKDVPAEPREAQIGREVRRRVRDLVAGLDELAWPERPVAALPSNSFLVSRHGESVMFMAGSMHRLNQDEAVELAVWLIALADPGLKVAPQLLAKVATR